MVENDAVATPVRHRTDVRLCALAVREMATSQGFPPEALDELDLVARELANNLLHHAGEGVITAYGIEAHGRRGVEVISLDAGPGFTDSEAAIADGVSSRRSLGCGLGAVDRLMHELEIGPGDHGRGARVVARRWLDPRPLISGPAPIEIGIASRPHPGMDVNGDAFVVCKRHDGVLTGIIDGLGHGTFAHRASTTARRYIEGHAESSLEDLFRGVARQCRATRGVVMSVLRFEWPPLGFDFAGIGNVELRMRLKTDSGAVLRRGILGVQAPRPLITHHRWTAGQIAVLFSDGLTSRWHWEDFADLDTQTAERSAHALLDHLARDHDDATVMVIKEPGRVEP